MNTCIWNTNESLCNEDDTWYTECGEAFVFTEDGPKENGFQFCPYCGGKIVIKLSEVTDE